MNIPAIRDVTAALISVVFVLTICLVVLFEIVNGKSVSIPVEIYAPTTLIVGYFFGAHAATNGALAGTHAVIDAADHLNATTPQSPTK